MFDWMVVGGGQQTHFDQSKCVRASVAQLDTLHAVLLFLAFLRNIRVSTIYFSVSLTLFSSRSVCYSYYYYYRYVSTACI